MAKLLRIGVFSFARFQAVFMGLVGLIFGIVYTVSSENSFIVIPLANEIAYAVSVPLIMLVLLPIIYAAAGFVLGLVYAVLFNFVAGSIVGGIQFEMEKGYKED